MTSALISSSAPPDRKTTKRPALESVPGGTFQIGAGLGTVGSLVERGGLGRTRGMNLNLGGEEIVGRRLLMQVVPGEGDA